MCITAAVFRHPSVESWKFTSYYIPAQNNVFYGEITEISKFYSSICDIFSLPFMKLWFWGTKSTSQHCVAVLPPQTMLHLPSFTKHWSWLPNLAAWLGTWAPLELLALPKWSDAASRWSATKPCSAVAGKHQVDVCPNVSKSRSCLLYRLQVIDAFSTDSSSYDRLSNLRQDLDSKLKSALGESCVCNMRRMVSYQMALIASFRLQWATYRSNQL